MNPLVSCIVPVFNGERFLGDTLDSIFAQAYRPIQVIVTDDGSTDGTANVVASYGETIEFIRQSNRGPASARNQGLSAANGEFIAFLDADDLWRPEKLTRQVARLVADVSIDYSVSHVLNFWEDEVREESEHLKEHPRAQPIAGYVTGTLLARRRIFDEIGCFNEKLAHGDATEWFLRARTEGRRGELMEEVLLLRRLHESNRSRERATKSRDEFLNILKSTLDQRRSQET